MNVYYVEMIDKDDKRHQTVCRENTDLANLINHLDNDAYKIVNVNFREGVVPDYREFCKKDEKLETGKEETDD